MPNPFKKNYIVTGPYGGAHRGVDLVASPWNTPVYSVTNGVVFRSTVDPSDGALYVIVKTGVDLYLCYWHLSSRSVVVGQSVKVGDSLGNQGRSGNATGPHLHFEVQKKDPFGPLLHVPDRHINPMPFLAEGVTEVTRLEDFRNCWITQAQRWPTVVEEAAWERSGIPPYEYTQKNAPNPNSDYRAFSNCFITVAGRWPSDQEWVSYTKSGHYPTKPYSWVQENAPYNPPLAVGDTAVKAANFDKIGKEYYGK